MKNIVTGVFATISPSRFEILSRRYESVADAATTETRRGIKERKSMIHFVFRTLSSCLCETTNATASVELVEEIDRFRPNLPWPSLRRCDYVVERTKIVLTRLVTTDPPSVVAKTT